MNKDSSSPERPSIRVTYLERQKRKRKIMETTDDLSDSNITSQDTTDAPPAQKPNTPTMKKPSQKPVSRVPKKIEINLPGPAPKRARRDSDESTKTTTSNSKKTHIRSVSSISSLSRVAQQAASHSPKPGSRKKPGSIIGPSPQRAGTPDSDVDDNTSIADSTMSVKGKRRLETERLEYFQNEPECGILEPYRAQCTRCNKFVALGRRRPYTVRPWEIHRSRCTATTPESPPSASAIPVESDEETGHEEPNTDDASISRSSAEERKANLESDAYASSVEPYEVICRKCNKTIGLSPKQPYNLQNWTKHRKTCREIMPSSRVETATRRLTLVNDSQAKSFGAHHVLCVFCKETVTLSGEEDFNLGKWTEHKIICSKPPSVGRPNRSTPVSSGGTEPASVSAVPFPVRPPASTTSTTTESTLIAGDPKQSSPESRGTKRIREEDEADLSVEDPDSRPTTRARNETYEAVDREAPSAAGWFMLPFKAFVRGFRESLKRS